MTLSENFWFALYQSSCGQHTLSHHVRKKPKHMSRQHRRAHLSTLYSANFFGIFEAFGEFTCQTPINGIQKRSFPSTVFSVKQRKFFYPNG